jgi:hypothetical protein
MAVGGQADVALESLGTFVEGRHIGTERVLGTFGAGTPVSHHLGPLLDHVAILAYAVDGGGSGTADDESMGSRRFELSVQVAAAPAEVIDFLADLDRHRGLHPFLVSASVVDEGSSALGPWTDWRVEERPRIGPVPYRLRFRARLTRTSQTSMTTLVRAAPGCWLRSATTATAVEGGSRINETTDVTAPWPVLGYMTRSGEAAHRRTFNRLSAALA